jgi:hypothetical protein
VSQTRAISPDCISVELVRLSVTDGDSGPIRGLPARAPVPESRPG